MKHVVTQPRDAFSTSDGRLAIHQVPAWRDNLIWLVHCVETGTVAAVDGPEAEPALEYCRRHNWNLGVVINTHTHRDHIGINQALDKLGLLQSMTVYGPALKASAVPGLTDPVTEGDVVRIGNVEGRVMLTEGHIDGHVSYVFDDVVFCGDTMFGAGCGYLFDGPPEKMHDSLQRLAALPEGTRVCCAHEYTEDNLLFAWSLEPDNPALIQRIREVVALRAQGGCSVPSTIGEERATNPFVRVPNAAEFARRRALKDAKAYKSLRLPQ